MTATVRKRTRKQLVKDLDEVFSKFIRLRNADTFTSVEPLATCVTCGKTESWKKMQCGHYESRAAYGTRWDEQNCHVQCYGCNVARKGNYTKYAQFMIRKYGVDILDVLAYKATNHPKFTNVELEMMIKDYTQKVTVLTNR